MRGTDPSFKDLNLGSVVVSLLEDDGRLPRIPRRRKGPDSLCGFNAFHK